MVFRTSGNSLFPTLVVGSLPRPQFATPDAGGIDVLRRYPEDKLLGLGVIDHTDRHVETPEEVMGRVERAVEFVPKERITLNPDCGFSPSRANPMDFDEAYMKLSAMCQGARMLREKYGEPK